TLQQHKIQECPVTRDSWKSQSTSSNTQNKGKMAELVPSGGNVVAQEQSSSVASSTSEVKKQIGSTSIHEKSSDFQSEELSRMVQESSSSISSSSTRMVSSSSSSVSSSVTKQRVSSSSIGIEASSELMALDDNGNQVAENGSTVSQVLGEIEPKQQVYESESSQEYFMRAEDGKVVEE
ncbi:hypothetical protein L9F63_010131, partial [Diploptera punctata]